jgi:hypothetical protein
VGELVKADHYSPDLTEALMTPTVWGDGDEVALPWRAPAGDNLKGEAERQLKSAEAATAPAPRRLAQQWLGSLGVLTAGKMAAKDTQLKASAYVGLLDYPPCCYTENSLRQAASLFTWFPSYSELAGFLDGRAREPRELVRRLKRIAEGPRKRSKVGRTRNWEKLGEAAP